jgi:N-ethylmaleimide reductase
MSSEEKPSFFTSFVMGKGQLNNRIVMAPMTRGRARNPGLVPTDLHVEYYRQRASAGLILTEATWISREAIGFINVPGIFTNEQVTGWRAVTEAVHKKGGTIFVQLAHSGAVSHPDFFDGQAPFAPSAINPGLRAFTADGFKPTVTPCAMTSDDIKRTIADYAAAARNAREASFDGVELHAGTTYLLPQFLNSALNQRTDAYGGSAQNRTRLVLESFDALIDVWGAGHIGVKISPAMAMGGFAPTEATVETYDDLTRRIDELPLSHLQVVRAPGDLTGAPVAALQDTISYFRRRYRGALIANGDFDKASATRALEEGHADLVAFGKLFIGNPDLVRRFRADRPLSASATDTYYQGGSQGFLDYPPVSAEKLAAP